MIRVLSSSVRAAGRVSGAACGVSRGVPHIQIASFSNFSSEEPDWLVEAENTPVDSKYVANTYVTEGKRLEMFKKHQSDPKKWTSKTLAMRYGMSIRRAQAILYLMKEREEHMRERGVLDISNLWMAVYEDHLNEPEIMTTSRLAEKHDISEEEAERIVKNMSEHAWRKENLNSHLDYMDWCMDLMETLGLDPSFKEIGVNKTPGSTRYEEYFEPTFFGDEDFEQEKQRLRARLIQDTRTTEAAQKPKTFMSFESRVRNARDVSQDPLMENRAGVRTDAPRRWKYAFRELAPRKKGEAPNPTMICTRRGELRPANPAEELQRSWSRQPSGIDNLRGLERLRQYMEAEKEDVAEARAISKRDRLRREAKLREHDLLTYKK
mmetsp:Transcript_6413/g.9679  ORF Transcript_6413/g.9679 Transcript_6413/m.9679 type:complete len:379 (+) Transcript_6413:37-1173(+)|eukprot:CAMPEP_0185022264 /NCGR_PEP_ID=MMETSP1103-20130426/4980_1 /TAXON_ID=36769 /ORGANISM="Paraphysomonas bandaiensis, Strain Caron Lab Isolate" /LENGTH=378 /DNA_ID=CAMNT_0027554255 /DNA_START=108 /DNA_END=1244 /DNA_ORIENTATION=+